MDYNDLKRKFGSWGDVADALGLARSTVSSWKYIGIPYGRQCEIELLTKGELKAAKRPKGRTQGAASSEKRQ